MQENTDQNNSEYEHFSRSDTTWLSEIMSLVLSIFSCLHILYIIVGTLLNLLVFNFAEIWGPPDTFEEEVFFKKKKKKDLWTQQFSR